MKIVENIMMIERGHCGQTCMVKTQDTVTIKYVKVLAQWGHCDDRIKHSVGTITNYDAIIRYPYP